jgi:hypothetical protein
MKLVNIMAIWAVVLVCACAYVKPACQVIKIADTTCDLLTIELPDGGTMVVSKGELRAAAERTASAMQDAGSGK